LAIIPSVQACRASEPNASVPGCKNRAGTITRQTLSGRKRGGSNVAKAVEASSCSNSDIPFTILKDAFNLIARKAVRLRKHICPSLVHVDEALTGGSDPQTSIPIAMKTHGIELQCRARKRIREGFPIGEPLNSSACGDQ
jgi:hypothetical protein